MTSEVTASLTHTALVEAIKDGTQPTVLAAVCETAGFLCPGCYTAVSTGVRCDIHETDEEVTLSHNRCGWSRTYDPAEFDKTIGQGRIEEVPAWWEDVVKDGEFDGYNPQPTVFDVLRGYPYICPGCSELASADEVCKPAKADSASISHQCGFEASYDSSEFDQRLPDPEEYNDDD